MPNTNSLRNKLKLTSIGLVCLLFLFLSVYKLGGNTLWHDEAEVALLGRQIIKTGLPTVVYRDSFLPISHYGDYHTEEAPYLFRLQTWLMFYAAALGMYLFGDNAFGARILFVLAGVAAVPVVYFLNLEITRNKNHALLTTLLLMLSIQYLVLIRNARYYSPVMFYSVVAIYLFIKYIIQPTPARSVLKHCAFGLAMLGIFYTHYLSFYAIILSMLSLNLFRWFINKNTRLKSSTRSKTIPFFLTCIMLFVFTTPWIALFHQHVQPMGYSLLDFIDNLITIGNKINRTVPAPIVLAGGYFLLKTAYQDRGLAKNIFALLWVIVFSIVFIAFITVFRIPPSTGPEFRYLLPIYPLLFILLSYVVYKAFLIKGMAGYSVITLLVFSNIFSYPWEAITKENYWPFPQARVSLRSYFFEYVWSELRVGYLGPAGKLIELLKQESYPGQRIFASSEGISLLFHLPSVLVDNDYSFLQRTKRTIEPEDLINYDWVVFRQVCDVKCIFPEDKTNSAQLILHDNFEKRILYVHDYVVDNREEIPYHLFSTPTFEPHLIVYKQIRN